MFPILFKAGPLTVHTYGFMVAVGIILAMLYVEYAAKKENLPERMINDSILWIVLSGIAGGRIFYIAENWSSFSNNLLDIFKIWEGGLTFYGGLFFGFAAGLIFFSVKKADIWKAMDVFAPAIAIGHSMGKIGCFLAGCCYGKICDTSLAVKFSDPDSLAPLNIPLHPVQLYEALSHFCIFLILVFFSSKKLAGGKVFLLYIMLSGVARFYFEFLRGEPVTAVLGGLSLMHVFSLGAVFTAFIFWVVRSSEKNNNS